jgi:hypothetical protein
MTLTEPMTLVTDYLMGAFALVLAIRLFRQSGVDRRSPVAWWGGVFVCTALASFVGGTHHGFARVLSDTAYRGTWQVTLAATGFGSACLLAAAALAGTRGPVQRLLLVSAAAKLMAYLAWTSSHAAFLFVIVDYGSALAAVLLIAWLSPLEAMRVSRRWLTAGAAVAVVAALIQALKLAPHPSFNHNDLYHVVQCGGLWMLYRGGRNAAQGAQARPAGVGDRRPGLGTPAPPTVA